MCFDSLNEYRIPNLCDLRWCHLPPLFRYHQRGKRDRVDRIQNKVICLVWTSSTYHEQMWHTNKIKMKKFTSGHEYGILNSKK